VPEGARWGTDDIAEESIKKKVLDVGMPSGASKSQVDQIQKAIEYGKDKGIEVQINVVK
jgi:hypothetical protein